MPTVLGLTNEQSHMSGQVSTDVKAHGNGNASANGGKERQSNSSGKPKGRLNTITKRNHAAAIDNETLLWRALTDDPEDALEYLANDCSMLNPVCFGTQDIIKGKREIEEKLKSSMQFTGFRIHPEKQFIEVDLMAAAMMYRVTLFQQGDHGQESIECVASSTWRQTAGADWMLVAQLVAYAD